MKNGWLITTSLTIDNSRILDVLCIGRKYWYTTLLQDLDALYIR